MDADRVKRARSLSSSSSSSPASSSQSSPSRPTPKHHRLPSPAPDAAFLCTLPPTCSQPRTAQAFSSASELARHQEAYHRFVCRVPVRDRAGRDGRLLDPAPTNQDGAAHGQHAGGRGSAEWVPEQFQGRKTAFGRWRECGKVLPDARLLELHEIETHDPLAQERQRRGEKIFQCFLPPEQCGKVCSTAKMRRAHMIQKHHYPKTFFFAVTNHGINQIAREDGLGASLIRSQKEHLSPSTTLGASVNTASPQIGISAGSASRATAQTSPRPAAARPQTRSMTRQDVSLKHDEDEPAKSMDVDELADALGSSLAFVPRTVRKKAGAKEVEMA
ncbi:hypothetical protein Q5752_004938 [Cryptotrichosporon argae]